MAGCPAEHDDLCEAALFYLLERTLGTLALENPDDGDRPRQAHGGDRHEQRGATFKIPPSFPISQKPPRHGARRTRR